MTRAKHRIHCSMISMQINITCEIFGLHFCPMNHSHSRQLRQIVAQAPGTPYVYTLCFPHFGHNKPCVSSISTAGASSFFCFNSNIVFPLSHFHLGIFPKRGRFIGIGRKRYYFRQSSRADALCLDYITPKPLCGTYCTIARIVDDCALPQHSINKRNQSLRSCHVIGVHIAESGNQRVLLNRHAPMESDEHGGHDHGRARQASHRDPETQVK
jgi:hypothetical protein